MQFIYINDCNGQVQQMNSPNDMSHPKNILSVVKWEQVPT
jgi:hypothetical protein